MLYYFKKGKNATEMQKKICAVYGEGAVTEWTCQKWSAKFRAGVCSLDDAPQPGRPVEVDSDQIETLTENNQRYTTWERANILEISKSSAENHLHQLGYVNCFDVWVPHKLSENNPLDRISTSNPLLKLNENVPFLKQIVMGDEKWILYNNVEWKRSWASEMNHHQPYQRPIFVQRRWCCVYGGIGSSIMSSFQKTKWLIPTGTAPNWTNWKQHSTKNVQN